MGRVQSIENNLKEINESVFQELCDAFLIRKNKNYGVFSRTGSSSGKQKTIKGTPDTFILSANGRYIFVEYSTNVTKGINKLKEDLLKCLDCTKTHVDKNSIQEIIICINFDLTPKEVEILKHELRNLPHIQLTIYSLSALALELNLNHRDLTKEYLGISFDSGQIVTIQNFVKEYNKASHGIATPLNNPFKRNKEVEKEFYKILSDSDITIITGGAGVGKIRLCIETIKKYLTNNSSYKGYCVSYKNFQLLEDLNSIIRPDEDNILFIDDANRIDAFLQIIGFYKGFDRGKLKIVIRDYTLSEIKTQCFGLPYHIFRLDKMSDEQITKIISSKPYQIKNLEFQRRILEIADGNPRIAIMCSLLSIETQNILALYNLSEVFEQYFTLFIKDKDLLSSTIAIKCLAIISFYQRIPYESKANIDYLLLDFGIEYHDFVDIIDKLDKAELVDIRIWLCQDRRAEYSVIFLLQGIYR